MLSSSQTRHKCNSIGEHRSRLKKWSLMSITLSGCKTTLKRALRNAIGRDLEYRQDTRPSLAIGRAKYWQLTSSRALESWTQDSREIRVKIGTILCSQTIDRWSLCKEVFSIKVYMKLKRRKLEAEWRQLQLTMSQDCRLRRLTYKVSMKKKTITSLLKIREMHQMSTIRVAAIKTCK